MYLTQVIQLTAASCNFKLTIYVSINPIVYTKQTEDEDLPEVFVEKLKSLIELVYNSSYKKPKPFTLTKEEQKDFESSVVCRL